MRTWVVVAVLLAGEKTSCGDGGTRPGDTSRADAARPVTTTPVVRAGFRFVKPRLVIFTGVRPDPQTNIRFETFVRLNHPLPRDRRGYRAAILLEDPG
jgi:hypothetical protein